MPASLAQTDTAPRGPQSKSRPALAASPGRRYLAEFIGTFFLTLVAAGGEVIAVTSGGQVSPAAKVVAPALVILALIYAVGDCSGAHFNPAVTFAFTLRGDFPIRRVPGYWLFQLLGALSAALVLRGLFGLTGHVGASVPHGEVRTALVLEVLTSCLLVMVILGTATRHRLLGPQAALAVGATISLVGLFAGPVSGASMNPARSSGPAVVAGEIEHLWIYIAGPFLGSAIAVGLMSALKPRQLDEEKDAACGEDGAA